MSRSRSRDQLNHEATVSGPVSSTVSQSEPPARSRILGSVLSWARRSRITDRVSLMSMACPAPQKMGDLLTVDPVADVVLER
jgi:hypothetical protein